MNSLANRPPPKKKEPYNLSLKFQKKGFSGSPPNSITLFDSPSENNNIQYKVSVQKKVEFLKQMSIENNIAQNHLQESFKGEFWL